MHCPSSESYRLARSRTVRLTSRLSLRLFTDLKALRRAARIPPCDTLGHKADCWNVSKPDFVCALQALTRGDLFIVRLLTEDQQIFAESFWKPEKPMSSVRVLTLTPVWCSLCRISHPSASATVNLSPQLATRTPVNFSYHKQ